LQPCGSHLDVVDWAASGGERCISCGASVAAGSRSGRIWFESEGKLKKRGMFMAFGFSGDRGTYAERETRERDCVGVESGIIYMRTRHQEMHS
jgi:hypothetical protein